MYDCHKTVAHKYDHSWNVVDCGSIPEARLATEINDMGFFNLSVKDST